MATRTVWLEICHAVTRSACRALIVALAWHTSGSSLMELDDSNMVTWSAAVSLSFMMTPMTRRRQDAAVVALAFDLS